MHPIRWIPFTRKELHELLGDGWQLEASRTGGLLLLPLSDFVLWPFYRLQRTSNALYRALHRIAETRYRMGLW